MLCGATTFDDEQQGPFRYLGDQRLPLFRALVRQGRRPLGHRFDGVSNNDDAVITLRSCPLAGLFLGVCGAGDNVRPGIVPDDGACLRLLYRRSVRPAVPKHSGVRRFRRRFEFASCRHLVAFLAGKRLHAWQALGPPVLLLASTPLLLRPWAAGRIASWTTAARFTPFVVLIGLWIVGGLWYRVLEIPNVPEQVDLEDFRAKLPTEKENKAGELVRRACLNFGDLYRKYNDERSRGSSRRGNAAHKSI